MLVAGVLLAAARRFLGWSVSEPARHAVPPAAEPRAVHGRRAACGAEGAAGGCRLAPAEEPLPVVSAPARLLPASPIALIEAGEDRGSRPATRARAGGRRRTATRTRRRSPSDDRSPVDDQPPPSVATSRLAEESRLLTLALRELRQDNDPAGALATLDEHAAALRPGRRARRPRPTPRASRRCCASGATPTRWCASMVWRWRRPARAAVCWRRARSCARSRAAARRPCSTSIACSHRAGEHDAIVERALHGRAGCRAQAGRRRGRARRSRDLPGAISRRAIRGRGAVDAAPMKDLERAVAPGQGRRDHDEAIQRVGRARAPGRRERSSWAGCSPAGAAAAISWATSDGGQSSMGAKPAVSVARRARRPAPAARR